MHIYLPIAELSIAAELFLGMALMVGFISGVFGVGGGFVLTPLLIFSGIPPAVAVATQSNQLVASGITGVLGHLRQGNVDIKLGLVMLAGSSLGSLIGILLFSLLKYLGQIDVVIALSYVSMLSVIGGLMLIDVINAHFKIVKPKEGREKSWYRRLNERLPYKMRFNQSRIYISALMPAGIGFVGGVLTAIMGVGGGFILVPAMIYMLRMSPLMVAGTSLFQIMFTSAFTAILHSVVNKSVDMLLAIILVIGGAVGAQFGVRFAKYVSGIQARAALSFMILAVAVKLATDLVLEPEQIYSIVVRG